MHLETELHALIQISYSAEAHMCEPTGLERDNWARPPEGRPPQEETHCREPKYFSKYCFLKVPDMEFLFPDWGAGVFSKSLAFCERLPGTRSLPPLAHHMLDAEKVATADLLLMGIEL